MNPEEQFARTAARASRPVGKPAIAARDKYRALGQLRTDERLAKWVGGLIGLVDRNGTLMRAVHDDAAILAWIEKSGGVIGIGGLAEIREERRIQYVVFSREFLPGAKKQIEDVVRVISDKIFAEIAAEMEKES